MKVSGLSGEHSTLQEIVEYKITLEKAIEHYYGIAFQLEDFALYTPKEIKEEKKRRLEELEEQITLWLLTAMEAWLRLDFEIRIRKRFKDSLSKELRKLYKRCQKRAKRKEAKVRLEDILDAWRKKTDLTIFSEIKALMEYRNWLAHGKYWFLKKRRYSFDEDYIVAEKLDKIFREYSKKTYGFIRKKGS